MLTNESQDQGQAAVIDSTIRVRSDALSDSLAARIRADLTVPNLDKQRALAESVYGAGEMPDHLALWREVGDEMVLPRGYAHALEHAASEEGLSVTWDSRMTLLPPSAHLLRSWPVAVLRDYQRPALEAALDWGQGLIAAPTGSGKTVVALEVVRWAGQRTLVVVGKTSLARQWQAKMRETYGYDSGYVGEGEMDVREVTVALWQTLGARRDELPADFWAQFGCVVFDEAHHCAASVLSGLIERLPAFYRLGFSATPRWDEGSWPVVRALFGPVVHRVEAQDVGEALVTPRVVVVPTEFQAEYVGTHFRGRRRVQNNYSEIMGKLATDPARNDLIARIAREEAQEGHHVLIVTRRREHVKQLVARLEKVLRVGSTLHTLTGSQTGADAERVARAIAGASTGTVLVSTIAEEALNFPRLDRVILAYPTRKLPLIEQQVGRVLRPAPGKDDAVVYDLSDSVGPLVGQRAQRERLYARRGWAVSAYEQERAAA